MLTDEWKQIRELGLRRILKARIKFDHQKIRTFTIPPLNFDANDYIGLITWQNCNVTEPPLTHEASSEDLELMVKAKDAPLVEFPQFLCHTQAVKRCIKLVTETSAAVCGTVARDGLIRARLASRKIIPCFNTKSEFCFTAD